MLPVKNSLSPSMVFLLQSAMNPIQAFLRDGSIWMKPDISKLFQEPAAQISKVSLLLVMYRIKSIARLLLPLVVDAWPRWMRRDTFLRRKWYIDEGGSVNPIDTKEQGMANFEV